MMVCKVGTKEDRRAMAMAHHNAEHGQRDDIHGLEAHADSCKDCYFELLEKGHY